MLFHQQNSKKKNLFISFSTPNFYFFKTQIKCQHPWEAFLSTPLPQNNQVCHLESDMVKVRLVRLHSCKVTLPLLSLLSSWMEVLLCSPHVRSRELSSLCQREEYLHWLFAILLPGRLASSLPCIYVLTRLFLLACIICFFNLCSHSTYHSLALSKFSLVFVERMRRRVIERTANLCCLQIQMLKP